jgi:hypothetical protein
MPYITQGTSFYKISDKYPIGQYESKVDLLTMHSLLLQILTKEKLSCPLKYGSPLKCFSFSMPETSLCLWQNENGEKVAECLVDVLEKMLGILWPEPNEDEDGD